MKPIASVLVLIVVGVAWAGDPASQPGIPVVKVQTLAEAAAEAASRPSKATSQQAPAASQPSVSTAMFLGGQDQWAQSRVTYVDLSFAGDGTIIRVEGSGSCVVRLITGHGKQEKRFIFKLSAEESLALRKVLLDADFMSIPPPRAGKPLLGEHCPRITLRNADGNTQRQEKWSNDVQESFDKVQAALLDLVKKTNGLEADYEGQYQRDWTPTSAPASGPATKPANE